MTPSLADLSEPTDPSLLPPLDRPGAPALNPYQAHWRDQGYLILPRFTPNVLIDAYVERRSRDGQYRTGTPYMEIPEIRDLCLWKPLADVLDDLIGERMALNLNLCGWISTERDYHQDIYLNPPFLHDHYLAVWFALADIHPDSGPFEYVPQSHRWPRLSRERVLACMPAGSALNPDWPKLSEDFVSAAMEAEIERTGLPVKRFIARKGDVLIWHCRLTHRGSPPRVPGMERRALIAHYSGINHRLDMPKVEQHGDQGWYFVLP